ncbi:c-type cytochrome [Noviherbaspirillum massiliense]|uniref:c-type cytochrome n=1 Tax=Noviherbaspirillum massiliense TaxID=1465823 RepID=UPI00037FDF92|nr:cytochrome c [Noviherbaspirillum massiliense]
MPDNKRSSLRDGMAAALLSLSLLNAAPGWAADGQAGKSKATQCAACHGMDGMAKAPDAPNLAGQNEAYLVKALKDFKSGARKHEVMSMMARNLSDADIEQLAAYYNGIAVTVKAP